MDTGKVKPLHSEHDRAQSVSIIARFELRHGEAGEGVTNPLLFRAKPSLSFHPRIRWWNEPPR